MSSNRIDLHLLISFVFIRLAWIDETSMIEIMAIHTYSKLSMFEILWKTRIDSHMEGFMHLNTIYIYYFYRYTFQCHWGRTIETKYYRIERYKFCKSYNQSCRIILFLVRLTKDMIHILLLQMHYHRVEWIVMMEDLHQSFHSNSFNICRYCW